MTTATCVAAIVLAMLPGQEVVATITPHGPAKPSLVQVQTVQHDFPVCLPFSTTRHLLVQAVVG
ncbi:hypothetical protein [Nitrospira sp. Nam74]